MNTIHRWPGSFVISTLAKRCARQWPIIHISKFLWQMVITILAPAFPHGIYIQSFEPAPVFTQQCHHELLWSRTYDVYSHAVAGTIETWLGRVYEDCNREVMPNKKPHSQIECGFLFGGEGGRASECSSVIILPPGTSISDGLLVIDYRLNKKD